MSASGLINFYLCMTKKHKSLFSEILTTALMRQALPGLCLMPDSILCLTPDDFTHQGESTQRRTMGVNLAVCPCIQLTQAINNYIVQIDFFPEQSRNQLANLLSIFVYFELIAWLDVHTLHQNKTVFLSIYNVSSILSIKNA